MISNKANIGLKFKLIKIPAIIRFSIIGFILLLIIFSTVNIYTAYQQPTTTEEKYPVVSFSHTGRYNYVVYLDNNTVYNKTQLLPGEGAIFRQIVDSINLSFSYIFNIDTEATIITNYNIQAILNTNLWTKKYTIKPNTQLNSTGKSINFKEQFNFNYTYYEEIINKINEEIGVTTQNPTLEIKCNIYSLASTNMGDISKSISPTISFSLFGKTIDVSEILFNTESGTLDEIKIISHPEVYEQRNNSSILAIFFTILLIIFIVLTEGKAQEIKVSERMLKKIKKKYGEWMIEAQMNPIMTDSKIINISSIDDLSKVSEELGKPMIHYEVKNSDIHEFYVVDDSILYKYVLKSEEKIKKLAICPQCKHEIPIEGYPGSRIEVNCNKCGKKGVISLGEEADKKSVSNYFNKLFKRNF